MPSVQEPGTVIVSMESTGEHDPVLTVTVGPTHGIGLLLSSKQPDTVRVEVDGGGQSVAPFVIVIVLVGPPSHGTGLLLSSKQPETVMVAVVGGGLVGH